MLIAAMSTSDVLAVVAATVVTILVAVLATTLVLFARTLRELRVTVDGLREDAIALLDETGDAVHDAARRDRARRAARHVGRAARRGQARDRHAGGQGDGIRYRSVAGRATATRR